MKSMSKYSKWLWNKANKQIFLIPYQFMNKF